METQNQVAVEHDEYLSDIANFYYRLLDLLWTYGEIAFFGYSR